MTPRVGQPELGVLPAANDVGAFTQLIGAAAAVVELQGDRRSGRAVAATAVRAVATGRLAVVGGLAVLARLCVLGLLAVVVVAVRGLGVSAGLAGVSPAGTFSAYCV